MKTKLLTILLLASFITGCSKEKMTFDKMRLEEGENGLVALSEVQKMPPSDNSIAWVRTSPATVTAYVRRQIQCPKHISRNSSSVSYKADKIILCYDFIADEPGQETTFYGKCPQDLIVKYDFHNFPKDVEPVFESQEGVCS